MNKLNILVAVISAFTFLNNVAEATDKIVCYFGSWAVYRPGQGRFDVEDIEPLTSICTHLIFGFAGLDAHTNHIIALDAWNELETGYGKGAYKRFNNLRNRNPKLKTILAIGGWNEGSIKYSAMAANPAHRQTFVNSVVGFLSEHRFDGLDMDWEYPANRGGVPSDKENFILLLKDLREAFDKHGFLLTSAVSAGKATIDTAYDVPNVAKYLDLINVMAYDFNGAWNTHTGHNAPLFVSPQESAENQLLNVNYSINYWIQKGAPREKIVLGMGLYGRSFTIVNPNNNKPGDGALGAGTAGPYTREPGTLGYNEICERQNSWTVVQEPHYRAPYAYSHNQWVGYDDRASIKVKTEYARCMGLGGAMVWSVETDDFHGNCHGQTFPLLKAIKQVLDGGPPKCPVVPDGVEPNTDSPTDKPEPTTGVVVEPTNPKPTEVGNTSPGIVDTTTVRPATSSPSFACPGVGLFRDPEDCGKFYSCKRSDGDGFVATHHDCGEGTVFDEKLKICQWPHLVPECHKGR